MSNQIGQPPRFASRAARAKGVLLTATTSIVAVGMTCALALPAPAFASAVPASAVTAKATATTWTPLLTGAGLTALLDARFAPLGAAVTAQAGTAVQQAVSQLNTGGGVLSSDGQVLTLQVPALSGIAPGVRASLGPIGSQLGGLSGPTGQIATAVNHSALGINPALNLFGPNGNVTASVPINLDAAVAGDLSGTTSAGVVTIDPQAGTVAVDLSRLLGTPDAAGSTLSPALDAQITADLNSALAALGGDVVSSATSSVENTPVNVTANVQFLTHPSTGSGSTACTSQPSASNPTASAATSGLLGAVTGTVDHLLGGTLGSTVTGAVDSVLCALPTNILPALLTSLALDLNGTIGQEVEGTAPPAAGSISVLGVPRPFNAAGINHGVGQAIINNIVGTTSNRGTTSGGGSGTTGSSRCSDSQDTLAVCLSVGGLRGTGTGSLLGGLGLGAILSGTSSKNTGGILGSLLGGASLPDGLSVSAGTNALGAGVASSPTAASNLLGVTVGTGGRGLGATVRLGSSSTGSGSAGSNLLNLNIGTPASGTSGGGLLNLGGLLGTN